MKVWKFCDGYVNIWIMGEYPERLVNRMLSDGIQLFSLEKDENGVEAVVRASDFKRLKYLVRGSGLRIRLVSRHGAPRLSRLFRSNAVFLCSLLFFAAVTVLTSTRLWFIRLETVSIPETELSEMLREMGAYVGAPRRSIRSSELSQTLNLDPRIVNAKVRLAGVTLTVTLTETNGAAVSKEDESPSSIYADKDCVIHFISVTGGRAKAVMGQAVKRGDLLITGDLSELKEGYRVRADGLILGEVMYSASAVAEPATEKDARTGEHVRVIALTLFGRELLLNAPFEEYELEETGSGRFDSSPLPIGVRAYECWELKRLLVPDEPENVEERARLTAQERLAALLPEDAKLISILTKCTHNQDGSVTAVITAASVERIGVRRELDGK